jgi:hypothetical protein
MVTSKPSIFPSASRYELVRSRLQYFITDVNVSVYLFYTMLNQVFNSLVPYYRTQKKEFSHHGLTLNIFNSKAKGTPQENMKRTNNPLHLEELKRVCAISKHLIDSAYNKYLVSIESCLDSTPKNFLEIHYAQEIIDVCYFVFKHERRRSECFICENVPNTSSRIEVRSIFFETNIMSDLFRVYQVKLFSECSKSRMLQNGLRPHSSERTSMRLRNVILKVVSSKIFDVPKELRQLVCMYVCC